MNMSPHDKEHIEAILNGYGDWFGAQLLRLIARADIPNREALRLGYPEEVEAYERWFYKEDYDFYQEMKQNAH
jgi:hypothetical protein